MKICFIDNLDLSYSPLVCFKGGSGGGGGTSGKVDYPSYMKKVHEALLTKGLSERSPASNSLFGVLEGALGNSPYVGVEAYDPAAYLAASQDRFDTYDDLVTAFVPDAVWLAAIDTVYDKILSKFDNGSIDGAVTAFQIRQEATLLASEGRLAGAYADVGAVQTSSYAMALALLQFSHLQEVAGFNGQATLEFERQRNQMLLPAADLELKLHNVRFSAEAQATQLQGELNRVALVAMKEYVDEEIQLTLKNAQWDLELWAYGANVLGSIQGGIPGMPDTSKSSGGSAVGGALCGAAAGALAGTMVLPGIGTAIGALIGGTAGYMGSS